MTMVDVETGRFTVGVFQDVAWAEKGLAALKQAGFVPESLTVLARGPLVEALQGASRDLGKLGLSGTMRRVGFQAHDSRIFEALAERGGVLVAIRSEPRAADALAILHSYGGGNAAIGAWTGRV